MNSRRLGCTSLYTVVLQCISWRHMSKCQQNNSSMLCKGVFSSSLLKMLLIYHTFPFTHKSHFSMKEVLHIYQFNHVRPSFMKDNRGKGARWRHTKHRLFHCLRLSVIVSTCILIQVGSLHYRKWLILTAACCSPPVNNEFIPTSWLPFHIADLQMSG